LAYTIEFLKRARRDLATLPAKAKSRILARIKALGENPRPPQSQPLQGDLEGHYRLRVGDYRVIYCIRDQVLIVVVVRVGHRKEIYRRLAR